MTPPTTTPRHGHATRRASLPGLTVHRVGASLLTLLLIAVPPAVLVPVAGNPFSPPTALRHADAVLRQVDDATVIYIVAALAWLYWLHLLGCFMTELLQQAWGRRIRMPLPRFLFGANTLIASHLVAAILMSGSGSSFTPAPQKAATVATWQQPDFGPVMDHTPSRRTLTFNLAAADTAAGSAADAADVNAPATSAASRHTGAAPAVAGSGIRCRVLPPQGRHHDTLWDIAERHLGDGMRWRDIYALNEGRLMPDGQRLTRASLIRPGWILHLPADAKALAVDQVVATDDPGHPATPSSAAPSRTARGTATEPSSRDNAATAGHLLEQPTGGPNRPSSIDALQRLDVPLHRERKSDPTRPLASQQSAASPTSPETRAPVTSTPDAPGEGAGVTPAHESTTEPTSEPMSEPMSEPTVKVASEAGEVGLLGLAGLGLLAALTRRRKVAARRRPRGTRPATATPELLALEGQLRRDARSADDLSAALRLALLLSVRHDPGRRLGGELVAVWHHADDSFELVLDATETEAHAGNTAPAPFIATERGWLLPVESRRFLFATTRTKSSDDRLREELDLHDDPFPLLLPVGTRNGSACLVNLGHAPVAALVGESQAEAPDERSPDGAALTAVVAGWVAQLAGAPWAANCRILLAPSFADLAFTHPACTTAGPDDLTRLATSVSDTATAEGAEFVVGFRPNDLPPAALECARTSRAALAVLLVGHTSSDVTASIAAGEEWTLRLDGTVTIPRVGEGIVPRPLDDEHLELVRRLLEHAQDPPHAATNDPGLRARGLDAPATPLPPAPAPPAAGPDADAATENDAETDAETGAGPNAEPDAVVRVGAGTPSVDTPAVPSETDAANLHGEALQAPPVVRVDVLGPVSMTGTSSTLGGTLRQILLFLALHRRPVPPLALWEAVWPDREFNDHSLRSRCNELKRYLHRQLLKDGRSWVLPESVRCDWQEFKALAAGGHDDKVTALALVRGRPFEDFAPDWVHLEGFYAEIEATIVDLALDVATDALERGDTMTASFAAAAGAKASPYEERLVQLGIRAAQDRGAYSLARSLHRQLTAVLDEEIEPDDTELPGTTRLMADLNYAESRQLRDAERSDT